MGYAQDQATVTGKVTDKDMGGEALPFASVAIKGTSISTNTDEAGTYTLKVPAGAQTIVFTFLGYETKEIQVTLAAGETKTIDEVLGSTSVELKDVVIETTVNRQKESTLLLEQKNATEIKTNIGAQELARKGVSDVASAVAKTSGVTKQEGSGNIYVRGMGDRYNSTTMNGLSIPSNNVERKNISLDIFPTQIVEYVSIDKVYNNKIYGDFAGGNVDIVSRDYKGNGFFRIDVGSNINTNAVSESNFRLNDAPGFTGFKNINKPSNPLTQYNYNTLNLDKKAPYAGSIGFSGGDSYNVGEEGRINFFATGSFSNEYMSITDGKSQGSVNKEGVIGNSYDYESFNYATNTTGMANVGYKIDQNNKINFNTLFINTSSNRTDEYRGYGVDFAEDGTGLIRREKYQKTNLFVNQLLGQHKFGEQMQLNWAAGYNTVKDNMPDRIQNKLRMSYDGAGNELGYGIVSISDADNHRYFQDLTEKEATALVSFDYKFNKGEDELYKGKLTAGYSGKSKKRDLEAIQYNFDVNEAGQGKITDPNNIDAFYNAANFAANYFTIKTLRGTSEVPNALQPQTYTGKLNIHAAFITAEYKFSPKLTGVFGLRAETLTQTVDYDTYLMQGNTEFDKTALLPNFQLRYAVAENQNLRFGFSKTYTLPQFKENAPFSYDEVNQSYVGNRNLYESDNYNADIKWEMFPKSDEVLSITGFGKYIKNPINEVTISSSTQDISWANTGDWGMAAGAELEVRKTLWNTGENNARKLTGGLNVSYLYTNQELNKEKVARENDYEAPFTKTKSAFAGASNWLANADISYLYEWNDKASSINPTLAFNYFSDRIFALGTIGRGDMVDKAVGTLDFILRSKINEKLGINFAAKNLLNPNIERVQEGTANGDVVLLNYKKGVFFSLGASYQF